MANRYGHLVRAIEKAAPMKEDAVLAARVQSMRVWNRVRSTVIFVLSIGLAAAVAAWLARYLPQFDPAVDALDALNDLAATASALSGILTIAYLLLTRLLGQLEADILTLIAFEHSD